MHHPTDRIIHTTAFVTPVVEHWLEREIAQWVHPMKDRPDDQRHHERTHELRPAPTVKEGLVICEHIAVHFFKWLMVSLKVSSLCVECVVK